MAAAVVMVVMVVMVVVLVCVCDGLEVTTKTNFQSERDSIRSRSSTSLITIITMIKIYTNKYINKHIYK